MELYSLCDPSHANAADKTIFFGIRYCSSGSLDSNRPPKALLGNEGLFFQMNELVFLSFLLQLHSQKLYLFPKSFFFSCSVTIAEQFAAASICFCERTNTWQK